MSFNVVLVAPCIPQNTGNIGRLCVSAGASLNLIKPLGFSLEDKYIRRAGMDYWRHLDLRVVESWDDFVSGSSGAVTHFFSTKGRKCFWDCPFEPGSSLVFGNEESGFPPDFYERYAESMWHIPMPGKFYRSLNLSNSASIVLYEGVRRLLRPGEEAAR
jgi:tRNA (cytidine/uridine-2'-O-)-methyltransferase